MWLAVSSKKTKFAVLTLFCEGKRYKSSGVAVSSKKTKFTVLTLFVKGNII